MRREDAKRPLLGGSLGLEWAVGKLHFMGLTVSLYGVTISTYGTNHTQTCAVHHKATFPYSAFKELPAQIAHKLTFDIPKR